MDQGNPALLFSASFFEECWLRHFACIREQGEKKEGKRTLPRFPLFFLSYSLLSCHQLFIIRFVFPRLFVLDLFYFASFTKGFSLSCRYYCLLLRCIFI